MINSHFFVTKLKELGVSFYSGVPDSLTAPLIKTIEEVSSMEADVTMLSAANEGIGVAHCIGHFLATGNPGVVYMQNAGLGNAFNPIISIAHKTVFNIPLIFLIGWRGEPGLEDEPQHQHQGKITLDLLELMGSKTEVINNNDNLNKALLKLENHSLSIDQNIFTFLFSKRAFKENQ